jgi:hypothetical protein
MERGNTKHGRLLDEEMQHEVRGITQGNVDSRVDEANDPEPSGEDQPNASWQGDGARVGGAPVGMSADEVEERSRLGRYIPRGKLPGLRDDLLAGASDLNAPDDIVASLRRLPADETFATVSEVWAALGHQNEDATRRP